MLKNVEFCEKSKIFKKNFHFYLVKFQSITKNFVKNFKKNVKNILSIEK